MVEKEIIEQYPYYANVNYGIIISAHKFKTEIEPYLLETLANDMLQEDYFPNHSVMEIWHMSAREKADVYAEFLNKAIEILYDTLFSIEDTFDGWQPMKMANDNEDVTFML